MRIAIQERDARDDNAGRAIATLNSAVRDNCLLHCVWFAVLQQAFDGDNVAPVRLCAKHETRWHGLAIEQHRARAAIAAVTTEMRAAQFKFIAQNVKQSIARVNLKFVLIPVDSEGKVVTSHAISDIEFSFRQTL
jgi:hypothetical protein